MGSLAEQTRLEEDGGGDVEAFAQTRDVSFVEGAFRGTVSSEQRAEKAETWEGSGERRERAFEG